MVDERLFEEEYQKYEGGFEIELASKRSIAMHFFLAGLAKGREMERERCIEIIKDHDDERDAEAYLCGYVFANAVIQTINKPPAP
jgi:hypothetical protein